MPEPVNIHAAKTHLSRLVRSIRDGSSREIVIAVGGVPAARLVPIEPRKRRLGADAGLVHMTDDFDSDEASIVALFHGDSLER